MYLEPLLAPYAIPEDPSRIAVATPGMLNVRGARWSQPKPLARNRLSLGEYTFPVGFRIIGYTNDSELDETRIPYQDGAYIPTQNKAAKVIRVTGTAGWQGSWDSTDRLIQNAAHLDDELQVMASYLEAGYRQLRFAGFNVPRFIWALKRRFGVEYMESAHQRVATIEIEFICQEAKWHADLPTVIADIANGTTQNKVFNQRGSGIAYPVFRFAGPLANPAISIGYGATSEMGYIGMQLAITVATGEQLVIDCDPRSSRHVSFYDGSNPNGYDAIGTVVRTVNLAGDSSFWPYIRPGMFHVLAVTTPAGSSGSYSMSFRDVWTY